MPSFEALRGRLGAALARQARTRRIAADRRAVGQADRGEPKPPLLDRDAAGLVEQRLALARAHDERVDRAQHLEGAVQPLDPALLRLERAGLLEQLVDHHAQVLAVEVGRAAAGRAAAPAAPGAEHLVHLPQDDVVVGGLHQHARHAVRLRQRLRVLAGRSTRCRT